MHGGNKSTLGYFQMHTDIFPLLTSEQGVDHRENGMRSLKQWELTVQRQHSSSRNTFPPSAHKNHIYHKALCGVVTHCPLHPALTEPGNALGHFPKRVTYIFSCRCYLHGWNYASISERSNSASVKLTSTPAKFSMNYR